MGRNQISMRLSVFIGFIIIIRPFRPNIPGKLNPASFQAVEFGYTDVDDFMLVTMFE